MSRHKLIKVMDFDEELVDFDGGDEAEEEQLDYRKLTAEDREKLRLGTIEVHDILGDDGAISNTKIKEALWHYYYDTEETAEYFFNLMFASDYKRSKRRKARKRHLETILLYRVKHFVLWCKPSLSSAAWLSLDLAPAAEICMRDARNLVKEKIANVPASCSSSLSALDFFADSPWLNIPKDRCGEILIEPLYPRGGLLGGMPNQDGAPKSKLAALAAARKKKEHRNPEDNQNATNSVALLDKLGTKPDELRANALPSSSGPSSQSMSSAEPRILHSIRYPRKSQKKSDPPPEQPFEVFNTALVAYPNVELKVQPAVTPAAMPSMFAQTVFGSFANFHQPVSYTVVNYALRAFESHTEFDFAGPDPDEIFRKAHVSKANEQPAPPANGDKSIDGIAQSVSEITIEDTRAKGKKLNVLAEFEKSKFKNATNFVVIGHVDAGKSTLMGRLLYDLKVVDHRTLDRYRKESERLGKGSFALAWVLDQGTEERNRGVTIDIAMNKFETEKTSFTILDAPGHRDFIPNMIAGASQADFAVLVIDADIGRFESGLKGQTKEHALLVRSMGVQRMVVAINKLDTVQWSQDRFDEISQQVAAFLTNAGFLARNLAFIPCAGLTGDNIVRKADDPKASWYNGAPLISLLESSEPVTHALEKPLRLTISDVFRGSVQNPVSISGRLEAGSIQIGDTVLVMPAKEAGTIKGIDVDSEPAEWAVAGQNVVLHLAEIDAGYVKSGYVICPPSNPIQCVTSFGAKILAFEHITPMQCEVHKGRLHAPARFTHLIAQLDKASGEVIKGKTPRLIKPGSVARVIIEMDDPIPLEKGGKVILRAGGETIGAGLVE